MCIGNHDSHIRKNYLLPNVYRVKPYSSELCTGIGIWQEDDEYPDYVEAQSLFEICPSSPNIRIFNGLYLFEFINISTS